MKFFFKTNPKYFFMTLGLFSSYFSVSALIVNPVYVSGLLVIIFSLLYLNFNKVDRFYLFYLCYFLASLLGFVLGLYFFEIKTNYKVVFFSNILYLYCILLGGAVIIFSSQIEKGLRVTIYRNIYNILILFMGGDLFVRVAMAASNGDFYDYKWGVFYFDSNFTGAILLLFLVFSIFLKENKIFDIGKIKFLILVLLLIGTFSRAAIFSFFLTYFLFRYSRRFIKFLAFLFCSFALYSFYKLVSLYLNGERFSNIDGSFNSKFYLISVAIDNYGSLSSLNKIFGIGLANFPYFSDGLFAHNIVITFFYEFGFWGIACFLIFLTVSYFKIGKDVLYIFIPFFIVSFSLFSAYMPFFFVLIACMYVEKKY